MNTVPDVPSGPATSHEDGSASALVATWKDTVVPAGARASQESVSQDTVRVSAASDGSVSNGAVRPPSRASRPSTCS